MQKKIESEMISMIEYDESSLFVTFKTTGNVFEFKLIPLDIYVDLCACADIGDSVGKLFNRIVKGKFNYRKVN